MIDNRLKILNEKIENCIPTYKNTPITINQALNTAQLLILKAKQSSGIVYLIGNGGSAGIASHFCTDLIRTLNIPASTLFDSSVTTCLSNDFGYESVFEKQLNLVLKKQDLLIAISSSGKSKNILSAVDIALKKQAKVITLSGFAKNNVLRSKGDLNFYLQSTDYGLIEMGHFFLLHTLIDTWNDTSRQFIQVSHE